MKDFRKELRRRLRTLDKLWKPMWISDGANGVYRIDRGVADTPLFIDVNEAPAEMREPLNAALFHLGEQAQMARVAREIAKVELGISAGRSDGGTKTAIRRKREAVDGNTKLKAEAKKIQKVHPKWSISELARSLSERHGLGNLDVIRKKLPGLLRD